MRRDIRYAAADAPVNPALSTSARFRAARERAGLSVAEAAARAGISESCVWDLESHDDELMTVYSPADLQRFARAFAVAPHELMAAGRCDDPISAPELASAIQEHCRLRRITLDDFGDAAGWDVSTVPDAPQRLLTDFSLAGVRDVCRALGVDWRRFISGLSAAV